MCGALRAAATPSVCTGGKTGERGGVPFWCPSQHGASFGVQLVKSESLRVCVCVCMCASMCVCYAGAKTRSASPRRSPRASGRRACLSGGWVCGAGWAMCSCEAACVGMARGCREEKNACRARAVAALRSRLVPPATSGATHCVCAPHSPAQAVGCAAREAGAGSGGWERREPARDAARAAVDHRMRSAVCVRSPGWRGRAPWSQKRCGPSGLLLGQQRMED